MNSSALPIRFALYARACGWLAVLVAAVVLLGWGVGSDLMTRLFLGPVAMNPMTAVAFALAGVSLWLQVPSAGQLMPARRRLARTTAGIVACIGGLKLAAVATGWDPGIDQWLFAGDLAGSGSALPNRMAPNTALGFLLLGLALLALDTDWPHVRPTEALAGGVFLVALLALAGYLYQVPEFTGVASFIPMAVPTAMVFLALATGVLLARPEGGVMGVLASRSAGGALARRLLPLMVVVLMGLGWLRLEGERHGLYGMELGVALYTLANIAIFGALVWRHARDLQRSEAARERVAAARDQALALNRLIMDNSLDVICAIDGDGRFVEVSAAAEQLWGYPPSELVGKPYADFVHPDDAARTEEMAAAIRSGQPTLDFSNRYLCRNGNTIDIDWSARWSEADALMFCVARDATRRKQAEALLQQSHDHIRAIIATASDAFVAIDQFGTILEWNASAERSFGWTRDEIIGRQLSGTIIPHQHRQAHDRGLAHYLATGEGPVLRKPIEITALHRDGNEFPVELTIWPVTVGVSTTFNAFVRDITERRLAEHAIQVLNAELTANAIELEHMNRELESFSYSVSHDLRAPLRHIGGYARMLQEDAAGKLDPDMLRYLDTIGDSARNMGILIDDLLAFSRLGRQPLQRTSVDMDALTAHTLLDLGSARPAGACVDIAPLPPAHGDPALLRQVWINLLSNAFKYSAPRGERARVEISGERDGQTARYRIRDNGVGFDMRYAENLFGVFQRLHAQDEFEGTGVGLAIVQRVVHRHGGRVWAESQPDRGATFTVELPASDILPDEATT